MKYIELFAGVGGFRYGFEKANDTIASREKSRLQQGSKSGSDDKHKRLASKQFTCVYANEIDKYACQIYRKNFGEKELYEGDIREVDTGSIPDHDLLVGGFPCQSFSIAGKRRGFDDIRGTLFFEIARICRAKKPKYILLENVKGLFSHDGGNTFTTIIKVLSDIGYILQWQLLNSKNFGVPQNRERVFIIGHLRGERRPKVFPIEEGYGLSQENRHERLAKSLTATSHKGVGNDGTTLIYEGAIMSEKNKKWIKDGKKLSRNFPQGQRVYSDKGIASTIAGNAGGLGGKTGLYAIDKNKGKPTIVADRSRNYANKGRNLEARNDENTNSITSVQKDNLVIHNTITGATGNRAGSSREYLTGVSKVNESIGQIRRLTPTECCRLQGFSDDWVDGISDSQKYKCLGNAVTTTVIQAIGERMVI